MPGGDLEDSTFDNEQFVQQVNSAIVSGCDWHHEQYDTDMALFSIDGLTEQTLYEQMRNSVCVREMPMSIQALQSTT